MVSKLINIVSKLNPERIIRSSKAKYIEETVAIRIYITHIIIKKVTGAILKDCSYFANETTSIFVKYYYVNCLEPSNVN